MEHASLSTHGRWWTTCGLRPYHGAVYRDHVGVGLPVATHMDKHFTTMAPHISNRRVDWRGRVRPTLTLTHGSVHDGRRRRKFYVRMFKLGPYYAACMTLYGAPITYYTWFYTFSLASGWEPVSPHDLHLVKAIDEREKAHILKILKR